VSWKRSPLPGLRPDHGSNAHVRRLVGLAGVGAAFAAAAAVYEQRILIELATTPDPDAGRDFRFPASRVHEIVTPDGGRIHVEECGAGSPLLLLHGHGATLDTFALLARSLGDRGCRVVAMDQRGFGRSSSVPPMFDLWGLCRDAATVLEALGLRHAIVVGHSMGGAVALGLAISGPEILSEHVAGLVLINSSARGPADRALTRARAAALDWAVVERLSRDPRHGIVFARKNFGVDARRSHVAAARAIGFDSPVRGRRGFTRRLLGIDLTAALPTIRLPVLALAGSADRVVPPEGSAEIAALIPGARLEVLEGAGHMLPMERSGDVADLIVQFIADSAYV
jgi:pimeloyl-ACP methyl ester carboxylesterase